MLLLLRSLRLTWPLALDHLESSSVPARWYPDLSSNFSPAFANGVIHLFPLNGQAIRPMQKAFQPSNITVAGRISTSPLSWTTISRASPGCSPKWFRISLGMTVCPLLLRVAGGINLPPSISLTQTINSYYKVIQKSNPKWPCHSLVFRLMVWGGNL